MACVYRIVGDNGVYIGSTNQSLVRRFSCHKSHTNCASRQLINPKIELIEECTEEDRYIREQYWIDNTDCVNIKPAHISPEQVKANRQKYHEEHRDNKRAYDKEYRENTYDKRWFKHECPCGGKYTTLHKSTHLKTKKHQKFLKTSAGNKNPK